MVAAALDEKLPGLIIDSLSSKLSQQINESLDAKLPQLIRHAPQPGRFTNVLKPLFRDNKILDQNIAK